MSLPDLIGTVGVALIVGTYFALQLERIDPRGFLFAGANGLGALLILVSLCYSFNLSAAIIEGFWLGISLFGLYKAWQRRRRARRSTT